MARRRVSNKALATKLGKHPVTISRLKSQDVLPEIGGELIEAIRVAISGLSPKFPPCRLSDLLELEEQEDD
jgi:putative transcriptional regulator